MKKEQISAYRFSIFKVSNLVILLSCLFFLSCEKEGLSAEEIEALEKEAIVKMTFTGSFNDEGPYRYESSVATKFAPSFDADRFGNENSSIDFSQGLGERVLVLVDSTFYNEEFTLSIWIKSISVVEYWESIASNMISGSGNFEFNGFHLGINPENHSIRWHVEDTFIESPPLTTSNEWLNINASFSKDAMRLHLNGELVAESVPTSIPDFRLKELRHFDLGTVKSTESYSLPIFGSIDDIYFFRRTLTNLEIKHLASDI